MSTKGARRGAALTVLDELPFEAAAIVLGPERRREERGDLVRVRPWRSVTKIVTAYAALVALDRGLVHLEDPAGPPGATLRHLLAHASGLFYESDRILQSPGRRRHYSNRGIDVAAEHVAQAVGMDFGDWVRAQVTGPLGMDGVQWAGSPSVGGAAPLADLGLFALELLRPTLVEAATLEGARTAHFEDLVGIMPGFGRQDPNPFGLGFEVRGHKDPHWTGTRNSAATFGHFGMLGTALWVDPAQDLALVVGSDHEFCDDHRRVMPRLADAVLAIHGR